MTTAPTLHTARLTLRPHRVADFEACCRLWADPVVTRFIGGRPNSGEEVWSRMLRYAGHWALMDFGYWVVIETATGQLVGEAGLADFRRDITPAFGGTPETGWAMLSAFHGQGYAREALVAILDWATTHGHGRTVCMIDPDNAPSLRLAAALGYREYARTLYKGAASILLAREQ